MTRLGAVFWGGLVLVSGFATFNVKYAVQGIDEELARVRRQTTAEQQEIRVLSAEWAYLNQPERLAELNRSFLQLSPMTAKQLQGRVEEIAMRAPPAGVPDAMPHAVFAANPVSGVPPGVGCRAQSRLLLLGWRCCWPLRPRRRPPPRRARAGGTQLADARVVETRAAETDGADAPLGNAAGAAAVGRCPDGPGRRAGRGAAAPRYRRRRADPAWMAGQGGPDCLGAGRRGSRRGPGVSKPGVSKRSSPRPRRMERPAQHRPPAPRRERPGWPRRCTCSASMPAGRRRGCGWPRRPRLRSMR